MVFIINQTYFCEVGSPKAALDVVTNELYCFLSTFGSSSGWWPGNAIGSLALKEKKNQKILKSDLQPQVYFHMTLLKQLSLVFTGYIHWHKEKKKGKFWFECSVLSKTYWLLHW